MDDLDRYINSQMQDDSFKEEWQNSSLDFDIEEFFIKAQVEQKENLLTLIKAFINLDENNQRTLTDTARNILNNQLSAANA